jgi:hypothetical protein
MPKMKLFIPGKGNNEITRMEKANPVLFSFTEKKLIQGPFFI